MRIPIGMMMLLSLLTSSERVGLVRSGDYREVDAGVVFQAPPPEPTAEDVYAVGPYFTRAADLPQTEGIATVEGYCQICHGTSYITMQPPLPPETWDAEVDKMMKTHGAAIPPEAAEEIRRYLKANFTPETRKK